MLEGSPAIRRSFRLLPGLLAFLVGPLYAQNSLQGPAQVPPPAQGTSLPTGLVPGPAINNPKSPRQKDTDPTTSLRMARGMRIVFPIQDGLDTRWKRVGDYFFEAHIDYCDNRGYAFDWHMSAPAGVSGSRAVELEDQRAAHKVSLFYPDKESATMIGYTSIVRISDYLYGKLKAGEKASFETDGPDSPLVHKKHTMPVAASIEPVGEETVEITIDGVKKKVRAIKATTDIGWSYWILDNPAFPIMLQGDGPFRWRDISISYRDASSGSGGGGQGRTMDDTSRKAAKEARKMIDDLEKSGQATSYLILFDFDSDNLRPLSKKILDELADYLTGKPGLKLQVEGHTCTIGGKAYNLDLSRRRARSVRNYLVDHCHIDASRLSSVGYGFERPLKSNSTPAGRRKNRRVVFKEVGENKN
ncbi:MAG: OmpA family protein [Candidatus Obscuribacterales bacterium]